MKVYSLKWAAALVALQATFGTSAYAATPADNLFSDTSYVTSDKMAAIQEAVRQGLLSGDPQGTFRPAATLTRQELAVLLVRSLKLDPVSSSSTFKDVQSKQFAAPYIEAAQKAGFLSGDGLGNFRPNDPVTREELAAVFVRAVGGVNAEGGSSILPKDQSLVSQWAAGSVDTALRLGLIDIHDSKLNPTGEVKREDIAPFLLDIFKTQEQTATINSIDGDIVTIDNVPYLIEGKLKELIGNSNKDALKGAILKFNSRNRNVDGLQQLEIVQKDVVLNTNGLPESSLLRISGDGVQIKGDIKGVIELNDGVSNTQLNGNANHLIVNSSNGISIKGTGTIGELKVANANAKVTLNPNFKVEMIQLPKDVSVSQVIQNYNEVQKQIGKIQSADRTIHEATTATSSSVTFSSGGGTSTNSVTNRAPSVTTGFTDTTLSTADEPKKINLANSFTDADGDTLTYTAESSATNVATVAVNGSQLTLTPVSAGTTKVTVTANDGKGGTINSQFNVTITPVIPEAVNHAPMVDTSISNVTTGVADGIKTVSLAGVFADVDSDVLTFTATSTNAGVATVAVNGSDLKITPVNAGTVTITVTANDGNGGAVDTQFNVTITPVISEAVNHAPTVEASINNVTIGAADGVKTVSLAGVFADEDSDVLTFTATSTDTGVVTVAVNGSDLKITPVNAGTATITVTADDGNGGTVDTQFNVTITPVIPEAVNHAPTVEASISNVTTGAADGIKTVSLAGVFADEDSDALTYTATSTDTGVATVAVNGSDLKITPVNAGTATITVTANDGNGGTVDTQFNVTITPVIPEAVNHAPTVETSISNVTTGFADGIKTVSLAGVFADEDSDVLTYTATTTDTGVVTVAVNGGDLKITPVNAGTATITVTANDGNGGTVDTNFTLTVTPPPAVNHAPVVQSAINDISTEAGAMDTTIGLASTFADEDLDLLTYSADSSNPGVATVSVTGDQLSITPLALGSATVTVTADDGKGGTVQTIFQVTVGEKKGLFFSELAWGESDSMMQIIELYNAGSEELDASKIRIERSNGGNSIEISQDAGAFIPGGATFVIGDTMYFGDAHVDYFTDMGFYNDDSAPVTLSLYYDNQLIDTAVFQPYTTIARQSGVTHGNAGHYEESEWIDEGIDYTDNIGIFSSEAP
ncbi:S-layer homology domain-containing protein [Paenibacillus polymyxa]|uniref:S-layer homology domain-containing protein n=1 Tax=Paenibacillus polymyxa TaxID=1406 RepID=UPI000D81F9E0|nr:S-layer homology domain-containing protein [Paenibacillus polymyxa]MDU8675870.1 S-layer homology domain-containing protein [Paenibacillus polymyxa]MDU8700778.1 S-layer homology domain-containing protein [Paenibacillus polymyxa]URJ55379.3 S-layer homology domain-containing protein [Paenibacillus polymyxa]URJ67213.3 S-layer homology domain-containing protein [Paenibacillus polymyxa]URJ69893.1 S-layer homology domain-containing protein [Paenibacillus polymyxa]